MLDAIEAAVLEAVAASLTESAAMVASRARQKAPVRSIFGEGSRRVIRSADAESWAQGVRETVSGYRVRYPHRLSLRRLAPRSATSVNQLLRGSEYLTKSGRYEVASGRANYRPRHRAGQVGGRLKGEITSTKATIEGNVIEATAISPTPYAKYQEFGTVHNPAHPYMRPAAEESRSEVISAMATAAIEAGRQAASGGTIRTAPVKVVIR